MEEEDCRRSGGGGGGQAEEEEDRWRMRRTEVWCRRRSGRQPVLPLPEFPECGRLDAVGAPGGVAHGVADGDGEPAVVGPDQVDDGGLLALDGHGAPLAPVLRSPVRAWGKLGVKILGLFPC